jgi:hypothetical protein
MVCWTCANATIRTCELDHTRIRIVVINFCFRRVIVKPEGTPKTLPYPRSVFGPKRLRHLGRNFVTCGVTLSQRGTAPCPAPGSP